MTWVAAGIIAAGAVYSASQSKKGGKIEYGQIPQTEAAQRSRGKLMELAEGQPPTVPKQEIAPLPPKTEERKIATETAKELIQPQDFLSLPEVQGIIQESTLAGNVLTNRLGRMLQSAGALTATSGRDILGRTVKEVEGNIAASLAPFGAEERARRERMIPVLERMGLTDEERERGITQAEKDAEFQQKYAESQQLQTFTIPLLQSIISLQPQIQPIIQSQGTSGFAQMSPLIGPMLSAALQPSGQTTGQAMTAQADPYAYGP